MRKAALSLSIAAALMCAIIPARADETPGYLLAYQAYSQALDSGDTQSATREAERAWQLAEEAEIEREQLALLVQNYLMLIILQDRQKAVAPAQRALELAEAGHGVSNYNLTELKLIEAYAASDLAALSGRRELMATLIAYEQTGADRFWGIYLRALLTLATTAFAEADYELAYGAGTGFVRIYEQIEPPQTDAIANVILIRAASLLLESNWRPVRESWPMPEVPPNRAQRRLAALVLTEQVIDMYPPQESLDAFNSALADALAWHRAINAVVDTTDIRRPEDFTFEGRSISEDRDTPILMAGVQECDIEWVEREMDYPRDAERKNYIGGAMIGYRLGEDGRVYEARVISEVPQNIFGAHILKKMESWQADQTSIAPGCAREYLTSFQFMF